MRLMRGAPCVWSRLKLKATVVVDLLCRSPVSRPHLVRVAQRGESVRRLETEGIKRVYTKNHLDRRKVIFFCQTFIFFILIEKL